MKRITILLIVGLAGCASDDSSVSRIVTTGLDRPRQIAVDPTTPQIYWTDINAGTIMRSELDGSGVEAWMSGLSSPTGIVITPAFVYWAELTVDAGLGTISRGLRSGGGVELLVNQIDSPGSIAVDASDANAYWIVQGIVGGGADQGIFRAPLVGTPIDGSTADEFLPDVNAKDIALNAADTGLYYIENTLPTALRLRTLATTEDTSVHGGAPIYNSATVDDSDALFWSEGVVETQSRIVRGGGTILRGEVAHPQDIAYSASDERIYGIDGDLTGPSIFRIAAR